MELPSIDVQAKIKKNEVFKIKLFKKEKSENSEIDKKEDSSCERTIAEFEWLHGHLEMYLYLNILPQLPKDVDYIGKFTDGRGSSGHPETRRRQLEIYLTKLLQIKEVLNLQVMYFFLISARSPF